MINPNTSIKIKKLDLKHVRETIELILKKQNNLEKDDETLIDKLIFSLQIMEDCKEDIKREGYRIGRGSTYTKNVALIVYDEELKNVRGILSDLSLTPRERGKFVSAVNDPDDFDEIMSS
jgi:P27 family predicted phage terminase small subunit